MKNNTLFSRLALSGTMVLALGLAVAGCGGGGGKNNGPITATPKPSPTSGGQNNNCSTTYSPNYASSVRLLHWTNFPLKVYFVRDAGYSVDRQAMAVEGFDRWVQTTNGGATYNVVSSAAAANVKVTFGTFTGGPGDVLGTTVTTFYDESNTIESADVNIKFTGTRRNDVLTANHEFGHTLGIFGHSANREDLMYFEGNDNRCGCITPSDLNTLLTAYCGKFNKNANARTAPHKGALKTITIH